MWDNTTEIMGDLEGFRTPYKMQFHRKTRSDFSVDWAQLVAADGRLIHRKDYPKETSMAGAQDDLRQVLAQQVAGDNARGMDYAQGFDYGRWTAARAAQKQRRKKQQ